MVGVMVLGGPSSKSLHVSGTSMRLVPLCGDRV